MLYSLILQWLRKQHKHWLHALFCPRPSFVAFSVRMGPICSYHHNRSSFEKVEVRVGRSVSLPSPSQGQADCLWLKAASQYKTSPWMSDVCWQIMTRGFIKRQPVDRGELPYHIWCTPSQNVRFRALRLAAKTITHQGHGVFCRPTSESIQISTCMWHKHFFIFLYNLKVIAKHFDWYLAILNEKL